MSQLNLDEHPFLDFWVIIIGLIFTGMLVLLGVFSKKIRAYNKELDAEASYRY